MNFTIPDDILTASNMSEADLQLEVAIVLYKREKSVQVKPVNG